MHWDNSELPKELVIRPHALGPDGASLWHWSGSFHLTDK